MFNRRNQSSENRVSTEVRKYDPDTISGKFEDIILAIGDRILSPQSFRDGYGGFGIDLTGFDDFDQATFRSKFVKAVESSTCRFTPTKIAMAGRDIGSDFDHFKLIIDAQDHKLDDIALLSLNGVENTIDGVPVLNLRLWHVDKYGSTRELEHIDIETMIDNIHGVI